MHSYIKNCIRKWVIWAENECWILRAGVFFWPHMGSDIDFFIKKKCSCVVTKKPNVQECAPLVPIRAIRPFEIVLIDYVKLDRCRGGFEYILTVVDHFTRFAQAYPTRKCNGPSAADKIFNQFILQFGYPDRIHHDQGKEFNGKLFTHLHQLTGIKRSNTTPYHPEGDDQCERFNRTIINMLKSIPDEEKKDWKNDLAKLTFAYISTIILSFCSLDVSPAFLSMICFQKQLAPRSPGMT